MKPVTPIRATDELVVPFAPIQVWRVLADVAAYPGWWPQALRLRVLRCDADLVGSEVELRPFGGRPFRCRVDAVEEPRRLRMQYRGDYIEGRASGAWSRPHPERGSGMSSMSWRMGGLSRE